MRQQHRPVRHTRIGRSQTAGQQVMQCLLHHPVTHAHQIFAALRNRVISVIQLWRRSQVTAAREHCASDINVLFR
jgi:hypothetical protein